MLAKSWFAIAISVVSILLFVQATNAEKVGKVTYVSGQVEVEKKHGKVSTVKVNMPAKVGQLFKTGPESVLEITYTNGSIIRIGEQSDLVLIGNGDDTPYLKKGKLWANIIKLIDRPSRFSIKTLSATAAVRGTVFKVNAHSDSSSVVGLYEGTVDVGPADTTKITEPEKQPWGPPKEIPGPYEVSLETWIRLDPGSQIHVKKDGKYKTGKIDDSEDAKWVAFNQKRDKSLVR